ncbi:hypothetical protein JCM10213v2_000112 [Rhodosporidiobolus nylandii]
MELLFPLPINSRFDPQTLEANKDYSMTSPLLQDGSNYPCKGYNTPSAYETLKPVATLSAGSDFEIEFAPGGATHQGGSCQFSVSYDQGKTFAVIHSVIGGCPLVNNYTVPVPSNLPAATSATFAWTWQNEVGNREEYMNCAIVNIEGSSSKSFTGPAPFRANTFSDGTCVTVEGEDVVYPNPGASVEYGGKMSSKSATTNLQPCSYDQNQDVTISPSGSSSSGSTKPSSSTKPASSSASQPATTTRKATASAIRTSQIIVQPTTTSAAAATTTTVSRAPRIPWRDRTAMASASASTSSTAAMTTTSAKASSSPAPTAAATTTSSRAPAAGANLQASASASSGSGTSIKCTSTSTWSLCSGGTCTPMGAVAPGTACVNGAITFARQKRMERRVRRRRSPLATDAVEGKVLVGVKHVARSH